MDQTEVIFVPAYKSTYERKGVRQVIAHEIDEKHVYMLCVSSTTVEDLLSFQQVCSGQSMKSTSANTTKGMQEVVSLGFHFTFAKSGSSHYSTVKTMKEVSRFDVPSCLHVSFF